MVQTLTFVFLQKAKLDSVFESWFLVGLLKPNFVFEIPFSIKKFTVL